MRVRVEVTEVTFGQELKGIVHETSGEKTFQVEGTASAKAWGKEYDSLLGESSS